MTTKILKDMDLDIVPEGFKTLVLPVGPTELVEWLVA
jgi:hypothetical protein